MSEVCCLFFYSTAATVVWFSMRSWILPLRHKEKKAINCDDMRVMRRSLFRRDSVVDSSSRALSMSLTGGGIESAKVLYFITIYASNEDLQDALDTCLNPELAFAPLLCTEDCTSPSRSEPIRSWYARSLRVVEGFPLLAMWRFLQHRKLAVEHVGCVVGSTGKLDSPSRPPSFILGVFLPLLNRLSFCSLWCVYFSRGSPHPPLYVFVRSFVLEPGDTRVGFRFCAHPGYPYPCLWFDRGVRPYRFLRFPHPPRRFLLHIRLVITHVFSLMMRCFDSLV